MKLKTFWERLVRVLRQHISLTIIVVAALLLELTTGVQNYYAQSMIQNLVESYIGSEMRGNSLQIQNQLAKVEVAVNNMVWVVERQLQHPDSMYTLARCLVENNPDDDTEPFSIPAGRKPYVVLVVGVNGVGKTTTIGKLAYQFKKRGFKVVLGAADTFRAAAIEQLQEWGRRVDVPVIRQEMGSDPASVAYDTLSSAVANGADVVLIDTAGRLHNKVGLMNELTKIRNVMNKVVEGAPDDVLLVLDGSTGQNAFEQARQFTLATHVTQLAITKLDGTAKGGVVIGISDQFKVPVKYVGLGEAIDNLQVFNKTEFVDSLFKQD